MNDSTEGRFARLLDEGDRVLVLARRGGRWRRLLSFPATPEGRAAARDLLAVVERGLVLRGSDLPGAPEAAA